MNQSSQNTDHSSAENWYDQVEPDKRVDPQRALELKEKGFFAGTDLWYDFEKYGYDLYANDRDFFYIHPINGWFSKLIDDKRFIPVLFRNKSHYIPEVSIAIEKRRIRYVLESGNVLKFQDDIETIVASYLKRYEALFVKPAGLYGGRGAFKIERNTPLSIFEKIHQDHAYLISNYLKNEEYAEKINPYNLNTLRAYFYRHPKEGLKFLSILHRFGTANSGCVDNVGQGGMACEVNTETGELSRAFAPMLDQIWHDRHIDSHHNLTGFAIPDWENKLRQLQEILKNLFFLEFGAMDVAPTEGGLKLLEVNSRPSRRLIQCYQPAFLDKDFKDFCVSKGYKGPA